MKKILPILIIGVLVNTTCFAQQQKRIDSLLTVLKTAKEDTSKVLILLDLCNAKTLTSENDEAKKYGTEALALAEKIGFKKGIAGSNVHLGTVCIYLYDYTHALEYFQKALTIYEQINNKKGIGTALGNIGIVHLYMKDFKKAKEYYRKALVIATETGNKQGMINNIGNLGAACFEMKEYPEALEYFQKALPLYKEIGDKNGVVRTIGNIGSVYFLLEDYPNALDYMKQTLPLCEEIGDKYMFAATTNNLSALYLKLGSHKEALHYQSIGLVAALEAGDPDVIKNSYGNLAQIDSAMNNYKAAFVHYKQFMQYKDTIYNTDNKNKITELQLQYEFDKKTAADSIKAVEEKKVISAELKEEQTKNYALYGGLAIVLLFSAVAVSQRNKIAKGKKRSDELLLNILPAEVAEELKDKGSADAQLIEEVTVLFTDFKGFTAMSEKLSPKELVKDIHECFSAFDHIMEKHGMEKIKTIGDSYMAAGGLPTPNKTHATDAVKAALEIRQFIAEGKARKLAEGAPYFDIRIGIHTGPVVAGIVGVKKFQYDIWGDTVNTASRMESSGEVGKVNISETTYELVKDRFSCEYRGEIEAKGKGKVKMYFVDSEQS